MDGHHLRMIEEGRIRLYDEEILISQLEPRRDGRKLDSCYASRTIYVIE